MFDAENMLATWQRFYLDILSRPQVFMALQARYWQDFMHLCQSFPDINDTKDKRFRGETWSQSPFFHFLKEIYLLNAKYLKELVSYATTLDKNSARKVRFLMDQWLNAVSPSNFFFTNPEVLRTTIQSKGENLRKGMENFLQDLGRQKNLFSIQMTDANAYTVGKNLAITPGKIVYQNDMMQLIQYLPSTEKVYEKPLLLFPPWINKYYILDLQPHNSLVKWAVDVGFTVFMISWVNPDARHAKKDFSDYLTEGAITALDQVIKLTNAERIHTLGFCIGGTLLACLMAYLATKKDNRIASATFLAALLDFEEPGDLGVFIDENQISALENLMAKTGYLDGGYMSATFNLLRSNDLIWSYYVQNYLEGKTPAPFDILAWNTDATNMPASMHSQYLREMYLHNKLREPGGMTLAGVPVDISKINTPTYWLAMEHDHIAPWQSVFASMQLLKGPTRFVLGESGHIAGIVNPPDSHKYGYRSTEVSVDKGQGPDNWLKDAVLHQNSWWQDWIDWLKPQSGRQIPARQPLDSIEDSPGSYVKVRLAG